MAHTLTRHAHILFPEQDYKYLQRIARGQRRPLGDLVRSAVQKVYGSRSSLAKREAGERLLKKTDLQVDDWEEMEKALLKRYG